MTTAKKPTTRKPRTKPVAKPIEKKVPEEKPQEKQQSKPFNLPPELVANMLKYGDENYWVGVIQQRLIALQQRYGRKP